MPVCPKCHNELPKGAAWCPVDGTPIRALSHSDTMAPADDARAPAGDSMPPDGDPTPAASSIPPPSRAPSSGGAPSTGGAPVSAAIEALYSEPQAIVRGTIIGEYEVTGLLGQGGMGEVFGAVHPIIGKKVAIKVLSEHVASNREVVRRFVAEARAVNQIGHPNIVDVFAFGQIDDGRQYYVMEHLAGSTLDDELEKRGIVPADEIVALLGETLDALDAAHRAGIIHRDLKPDNIFICEGRKRVVKLLDFGIAKLTGDEPGMARTRTGMAMGTPEFMSPEQCRGANVDHRTDIYALGIILYRAFTGVYPFECDSPIEYFYKHTSEEPTPPSQVVAIPEAFEKIILRCLAKDADERFASAAELAAALDEALGSPGNTLKSEAPASAPPAAARGKAGQTSGAGAAEAAAPTEVVRARSAPNKLVLAIATVVGLALVGGGILYALQGAGEDAEQAAAGELDAGAEAAIAPDPAEADAAPQVAEESSDLGNDAAPEPALGAVEIKLNVRGAEVFVDGERVQRAQGRTARVEELPAGEHEIRVERDGFRPSTRSVTVASGETAQLEMSLRRIRKQTERNEAREDRERDRERDDDKTERDPLVDKDGTIGLPELMGDR